jgi:hypothetical protein
MIRRLSLLSLLSLALPHLASAQDGCLQNAATFDAWLNCRIGRVIAMTTSPQGSEKQAESPSLTDTSSTLVDASSASDFVGFGMTLFGLRTPPTGGTEATSGATSVTVSGYSLVAAAYGRDPLADRDFYYDHRNWRRVSLTVGRQPAHDDETGLNSAATNAGMKILLLDLREIAKTEVLTDVEAAVMRANLNYANISAAVQEVLRSALAPDSSQQSFLTLLGAGAFKNTLRRVDGNTAKAIDAAILARIEAEVALRDAIKAKIDEIKQRPQISVAWSSNLRGKAAPDEHRFEAIVDYRMAPRLELTANAGIDLIDSKNLVLPPGTDTSVGRGAAALKLLLADPAGGLVSKQPVAFVFSGDVQLKASDLHYRAQLKVDFPLSPGLSLPVSATWADSPSRINEKEVRGTFGFTIDTSKLAAALR